MEKIKYNLIKRDKPVVLPDNLGFGTIFTDHVFEMDYSFDKGWHNPVIKKLEDIPMHPASMYLHYGQGVFDGLKAFKTESGEVVLFRPQKHLQRINNSSKKLCIPPIDTEFLLEALIELVGIEKDWIPEKEGESLYIRPFIYGSEAFIGVRPSATYKMLIILSPVGAYYPEGFKPVKILVQDEFVRAVRKGLGDCKTPANYAASLYAGEDAKKKGFTQVLWLDGVKQKYIEEVGTMNIFIQFKNEIATPKLNGSILPGVTRDSVIQILKDWNMNVTERDINIDEVIEEYKKGNVIGVFGTGTAAIISSVGWLTYKDFEMTFNNGQPGELDVKLFEELTSLHYGKIEDKHDWIVHVEKKEIEV
jgi:branched-chain amino acid aminotransferase